MAGANDRITDVQVIASYNWKDQDNACILVPGERSIASLCAMPYGPMHLVANANWQANSFRAVYAEVLDGRVVITRTSKQTHGLIQANEYEGYRKGFEEHHLTTQVDVRGSSSHHRIVSYKLGGIPILLRYAADACLSPRRISIITGTETSFDKLKVIKRGNVVPHCHTAEISTRSYKTGMDDYDEQKTPSLWLAQTPTFILAISVSTRYSETVTGRRSTFSIQNTKIRDSAADVRKWEQDHSGDIAKLVDVLKDLLTLLEAKAALANGEAGSVFEIRRGEGRANMWLRRPELELQGWGKT
ncbi:geranylgeranyl pyrophosphate synthetase [Teratosphaeria destructans]|uniref:Geranylgeranyl pyrophosphate synthetase n=1 Tax=Teratosphaeria destructans TaxID=418781 RepID=A0A9W7W0Z1_9PEZI|nr:geranylgeranyl pyrophosphate synthetase [Teratosphaeria destructans]